jgi:hypothetical protein
MAKRGRKPAATDYNKIFERVKKELSDKKKALIKAERVLANAKKSHDGLVAETARLDMVERSLKALIEGTEPPTNIRYVYNYPTWVWQPPAAVPQWTYTTPNMPTLPSYTICQNTNLTSVSNSGFAGTFTAGGGSLLTNTVACNSISPDAGTALGGVTVDLSTFAPALDELVEPQTLISAS